MTAHSTSHRREIASDTRHLVEHGRTAHDALELSNRAFALSLLVIVLSVAAIMLALKL